MLFHASCCVFHSIPSACQSPDTIFHTSSYAISSPCPTLHGLSSPRHLSSSHPTHCYRIVRFNLHVPAFERDAPGISLHTPFCLLSVPHCVTHPNTTLVSPLSLPIPHALHVCLMLRSPCSAFRWPSPHTILCCHASTSVFPTSHALCTVLSLPLSSLLAPHSVLRHASFTTLESPSRAAFTHSPVSIVHACCSLLLLFPSTTFSSVCQFLVPASAAALRDSCLCRRSVVQLKRGGVSIQTARMDQPALEDPGERGEGRGRPKGKRWDPKVARNPFGAGK